jgi:CubicO group peptidase (beta-lactamase class C family)
VGRRRFPKKANRAALHAAARVRKSFFHAESRGEKMDNFIKKKALLLFVFVLVSALLWSCERGGPDKPDYWPTQGWKTATPESQGMDSTLLLNMLEVIWDQEIKIDSVLVVRNGYVVMDAYGYPRQERDSPNIRSCSKSVTSALIGIAIDKGHIKGVNQPVLDFFPERVAKNLNDDKKAMTLENLLTMSSGLDCRDNWRYRWRGIQEMKRSPDWVQFMIDLPMAEKPGTKFNYCNGVTFLLSAIIHQETGMNALAFAEKLLFEPLGITDHWWSSNPRGITFGFSRLHLRPRDMAKIGYLYLNNGMWEDRQILSSQWIKDSTRQHISASGSLGYGYQWWTTDSHEYLAMGYGGQFIFVVPDKNIVAVFTSSLDIENIFVPFGLLQAYIIASVKSDKQLPENPQQVKALADIAALWQKTSPLDREKVREKVTKEAPNPLSGEYVNEEYGFSVRYDAQRIVLDDKREPGVIFRKKAVQGIPIFNVVVGDIPEGMALKDTGNLLLDIYRKNPDVESPEIRSQELIILSDGTPANYGEITWRYRSFAMLTVAVGAYKGDKIIGVSVVGTENMPEGYLAGMAKSLKFKK